MGYGSRLALQLQVPRDLDPLDWIRGCRRRLYMNPEEGTTSFASFHRPRFIVLSNDLTCPSTLSSNPFVCFRKQTFQHLALPI